MAGPAKPLEYAPKPAAHRRRRVWRAVGLIFGVPLLAVGAWGVGAAFVGRAADVRAGRALIEFSVPSGTLAYQESNDGGKLTYYGSTLFDPLPVELHGAIFVHGRRAGGGPERLVIVRWSRDKAALGAAGGPFAGGARDHPVFLARVVRPATWARGEAELSAQVLPVRGLSGVPFGGLTLYAGQPDPIDRSHFTIDYDVPEGVGTIDGYLMPDDSVKLEARKPR